MWAVPMLAGSLVYDLVSRKSAGSSTAILFFVGVLVMGLGYAASCLTRAYDVTPKAAEVLGDALYRPPEVRALVERGIEPLPGIGEPVDAQKYVCAVDGNFVWWRTSVGVPIPKCPDHNAVLVRA